MARAATLHVTNLAATTGPDAFVWDNPFGGIWNTATNWLDATIGMTATAAPAVSNTVTVTGGTDDNFVDILGTG